jgi:hypothetical protein
MLYWRVAKLLVSVRFFRLAHDLARRQLRFRAQKKTGDGLGCELRPPPFYDKFEKITVRLRTPIGRYADAALAPLRKASRSALIVSASVVGMPWGKFL